LPSESVLAGRHSFFQSLSNNWSAFHGSGIEKVGIDEVSQFLTVAEGFFLDRLQALAIRFLTHEPNQFPVFPAGFTLGMLPALSLRLLSHLIHIRFSTSIEVIGRDCFSHCRCISGVIFAN
jgi:hypothetical protein